MMARPTGKPTPPLKAKIKITAPALTMPEKSKEGRVQAASLFFLGGMSFEQFLRLSALEPCWQRADCSPAV
jgi:hypothetical protein